jgi:transcriptional regulator with GAF, ATPase, and Fis domain
MPTLPLDSALTLIAELAEAAGGAHTEATLVPAASAVLARHLPLISMDLRTEAGVRPAREAGAALLVEVPLRGQDGTAGHALLALRHGPPPAPELLDAIGRVLAVGLRQVRLLARVAEIARRAQGESRELRDEIGVLATPDFVVATSPAMHRVVHDLVPLVAPQDTTVLVRGETGTGKELVARRIHALSRRSSRPFLAVNCGALPEGLVESALFGHERGAFTGAVGRHRGVFERAHGGTLFLDEVGELPRAAQAKLLRVLQEGEIERVGGEAVVRVDVRVIAATHRPLEAMVESGALRDDLYYRLHVFPIVLPPLRDRPEDLEPLARSILARLAARFGRAAPRLGDAAMAALRARSYPGNVRELSNVLEHALVLSPGDDLRVPAAEPGPSLAPAPGRAPTYEEAMRLRVQEALRASGGKIYGADGAAAALGLKPTTLQSKIRKLGIARS